MANELPMIPPHAGLSAIIRAVNAVIRRLNSALNIRVSGSGARVSQSPGGGTSIYFRGSGSSSGVCYIAEVDSDATGGGYYNCHLQTLDATDWNTTTADQIDDTGGSVVVANMGEIGGSAHALDAGDMLLCWQFTDDEGNSRYIGLSPKYFWWHA